MQVIFKNQENYKSSKFLYLCKITVQEIRRGYVKMRKKLNEEETQIMKSFNVSKYTK